MIKAVCGERIMTRAYFFYIPLGGWLGDFVHEGNWHPHSLEFCVDQNSAKFEDADSRVVYVNTVYVNTVTKEKELAL